MTDIVDPATRSRMMAGIRNRDTAPEMAVRRELYSLGIHYRLHNGKLPGRPDIVIRRLHTVIFVHGCYWHRHPGCRLAYTPKSNVEFWQRKLEGNAIRDIENQARLIEMGWRVIVIWECEVHDRTALRERLAKLLGMESEAEGITE
ncbi:MAG: DNA mismatch endonuclease Vsr [Candidatus Contendobacter sp.]|nr:DNA mismatch endonuclease Vsr [Candidatus Contendobacter sp.]MDG4558890.1 DNA mismatch endonuclease Vsr [Candidatus Contendobacter sp.]